MRRNAKGHAHAVKMTTGSLWKNILFFSLPLMLSQLLEVLFNLSDVAVAGKFADYKALGAVGSTTLLVSLFTGFLIGMGSGVNVCVAHRLGAGSEKGAAVTIHSSFVICTVTGLVLGAAGITFAQPLLSLLHTKDELDRNWQRLILGHVLERPHPGVLTGSPLTDVKITLAAGRAHLKHTEGGDFRQATYRAIRQGLMQAESVLLEPYYAFTLEAPPEQIGRAISDLRAMGAEFSSPEDAEGLLRVRGAAPVAAMNGYMAELTGYTHGRGRLALRLDSYRPCRNARAVIDAIGYDPLADTENTPDSVFCAHGAGFNVSWDKVKDYMHLDSCLRDKSAPPPPAAPRRSMSIDERELEAIMEREFGPIKRPEYRAPAVNAAPAPAAPSGGMKQYVIVDGYNLIFAWDELKKLAADNMDLARARLMDILSSYSGFTRAELVLVFDAYRTPGNKGSRGEYHNIHVAYTADGETADMYIERLANDIGRNYAVRVVTSDNLIRLSALRSGVLRASSKEFAAELEWTLGQIDAILKKTNQDAHKTRVKDGKG